jgi:hypothetical protein
MSRARIQSFNLKPGRKIGRSYEVEHRLGGGSEGEVYRIRERSTGILRAAKLFFPQDDPKGTMPARRAQKLEALRDCPIVMQYYHTEHVKIGQLWTTVMISAYSPGQPLQEWVDRHRGKRLRPFIALTILHRLALGLEDVHDRGEYHADVHTGNILISQVGVDFQLKLIDFYDWGRPSRAKQQNDILQAVRVLYDVIGGAKGYRQSPKDIREVCCGLRHDLILSRYPTMAALRYHLESFEPTILP